MRDGFLGFFFPFGFVNLFIVYIFILYYLLILGRGTRVEVRGQLVDVSPPTVWVPGTELKPPGLAAGVLIR